MTTGANSADWLIAACIASSGMSRVRLGCHRGPRRILPERTALDTSRWAALAFVPVPQLSLHTPVGDISVSEEDGAIVSVDWGWGSRQGETRLLRRASDLLQRYFDQEL